MMLLSYSANLATRFNILVLSAPANFVKLFNYLITNGGIGADSL